MLITVISTLVILTSPKGITINSENHGQHNFRPYKGKNEMVKMAQRKLLIPLLLVVRSPEEASAMDYVVCAHKAIDQDEVVAQLTPVVDPSRTTIVVIQNGVGNEEPFRKQFPQNSILTCVVSVPQTINHRFDVPIQD